MFRKYIVFIPVISIFFLSLIHLSHAQSWVQLTTSGSSPSARDGQTGVYDANNNIMIIFGGSSPGFFLNDVYVLSNANGLGGIPYWTQLSPTGGPPPGRYLHTAVYDTTNNRMIIFGGYNGDGPTLNDVWVLSNANGIGGTPNWTQLFPTGSTPTTRCSHTAVYDQKNNLMTIFGGSYPNGNYLNDIWVLSTANGLGGTPAWTQLSPTGSIPTARAAHSAVYDATNNIMTIFGGDILNSPYNLNDVWVLSTANGLNGTPGWLQLSPTGGPPESRWGHTAVYDATNNRMTIFSGSNNNGSGVIPADVWVLSNANGLGGTSNWIQLSTNSGPSSRVYHSAVYDSTNNRMIIFGGAGTNYLNDVWVLDMANGLPVELSQFEATKE